MYKDILLPIDLGDLASSMKALGAAVQLCKDGGAKLHVVTVVPGYTMSIISQYFPEDFEEKSLAEASAQLSAFIGDNVPAGITAQAVVANGVIYEEILSAAKKLKVDLIVIGSHRAELQDYLIGTNASRVVHHSKCSVLVVRD